jgi:hypothetical protein
LALKAREPSGTLHANRQVLIPLGPLTAELASE